MRSPRLCLGASVALIFGAAPLAAIVDRNGDGLSDAWAALYQPTKASSVDEDGDGLTNAQEALAGTDPLNAASRPAAEPFTDGAGNLVLRWRGAWGKRYTIESSTDLKTWMALPGTQIGRGAELRVVVQAAGEAPEARHHWRVVAADVDTDGDGMTNAEEIELGSDPTTADAVAGAPQYYAAEFFVSPTGSDANPGTKNAPFLTLEKAKAAVLTKRTALATGRIAVWLRGGRYELSKKLWFYSWDSGTDAAHTIDWRGYPGEDVRITGGKRVPATAFSLVPSTSPVWSRLDDTAKGKVLQVDLKPVLGITVASTAEQKAKAYGVLRERGFGGSECAGLEIFIDDEPMTLARWPDVGPAVPAQSITGDTFKVSGVCSPDVTGTYTKVGTSDGVSSFARVGLVGGKQWYLFRTIEYYQGVTPFPVWKLTTKISGEPEWKCYSSTPGLFVVRVNSAAGTPAGYDVERINAGYATTADPSAGSTFSYVGDRPARWGRAADAWVEGFWSCYWADSHLPITSIDPVNRVIALPKEPDRGETGLKTYRPWFAYNLLEEITQPGEWYLDRSTGILYLWPPDGFSSRSEVMVSAMEEELIQVSYTSHLRLMDMTFEGARGKLIDVDQANGVVLQRLRLRNAGVNAVALRGTNLLVSRCELSGLGNTALILGGGDRKALTRGDSRVEDCEIHHYGRTVRSNVFGVGLGGCGQTFRHNLVHDGPNGAVLFGGNEQLIEANELRDLCQGSADAGAVYCASDWGARGNLLRFNFIHRVHSIFGDDVHGIYMDEMIEGIRSEENILYDIGGYALKARGGRDTIMRHNLIVKCGGALVEDGLGLTWAAGSDEVARRLATLEGLGYRSEPWLTRYPECAAIPDDAALIMSAEGTHWRAPEGSVFAGNFGWGNRSWINGQQHVDQYFASAADNVVDQDPLFVDEAAGDLRLQPGSPVRLVPGWVEIPFTQIGIRE